MRDQALGQNAGQRRQIELNEIGKVAVQNALEGVLDGGMVAAKRENAEAAQQIEVTVAVAVEQILALRALKADVITDGLKHPDELLVEVPCMQSVTLELAIREHL